MNSRPSMATPQSLNRGRMSHSGHPESGFVSVLLIGFTVLLLTFISGFIALYEAHSRTVMDDGKRLAALHLAEGGVDHVLWRLRQDPIWRKVEDEQNVSLQGGEYYLKDLAKGPSGIKGIHMEGCTPSRSAPDAACAEVYVEVAPSYAIMAAGAIVGDVGVTVGVPSGGEDSDGDGLIDTVLCLLGCGGGGKGITGTVKIDSYNSENGPYLVSPKSEDGDITTNNPAKESLTIRGTHDIRGHVYYPKSGTSGAVMVSPPVKITGGIGPNPADTRFTTPVPPGNAILIKPVMADGVGPSAFKRSKGGSIPAPIPPGVYVIEADKKGRSIELDDNSQIVFSGLDRTVVYVKGSVRTGSKGILNTFSKPGNLIIYGLDSSKFFVFDGASQFHGVLYAPKSNILLNADDEFFGTLSGRSITVKGDAVLHYDENLRDVRGFVSQYFIHSWNRLK
jgi:hypothetical protein